MKKSLLILTAFALIVGCKDETPTPTTTTSGSTNGDIVGIWNFTKIEQENGKVTWDGVEVATYTATSSDEVGTFEFKSDGTVTNTVAYSSVTTFIQAGVPSEIPADIPSTTTTGTYVYDKSAKTVTITSSAGVESVMDIDELTATKLVLRQPFSQTDIKNGITVVSSAEVVITLTK